MKRKVLCRITSFCLAAILAAQSCMSVSAVQPGDYPETEAVTEAPAEEDSEAGETETADQAEKRYILLLVLLVCPPH